MCLDEFLEFRLSEVGSYFAIVPGYSTNQYLQVLIFKIPIGARMSSLHLNQCPATGWCLGSDPEGIQLIQASNPLPSRSSISHHMP